MNWGNEVKVVKKKKAVFKSEVCSIKRTHLRCFNFVSNMEVTQTHTCGSSDGVGAGDEGLAVV